MAIAQANVSRITSGGLEVVKWLALVLMVVDHVNAVFFARELPLWAELLGRVCFPLFAFVFAYNLARPGVDRMRLANRLVIAGCFAQPFHGIAFDTSFGLFPLNIMFLFAGMVGVVELLERRRVLQAVAAAMVLSSLVEYSLSGVLLCLTAWAHFRRPSIDTATAVAVALGALCLHNGNAHALWAVPVFWILSQLPASLPRARWAFYAFYPAHLAVLVALAAAGVGAAHG